MIGSVPDRHTSHQNGIRGNGSYRGDSAGIENLPGYFGAGEESLGGSDIDIELNLVSRSRITSLELDDDN